MLFSIFKLLFNFNLPQMPFLRPANIFLPENFAVR